MITQDNENFLLCVKNAVKPGIRPSEFCIIYHINAMLRM